jgi:hypothetical protein
MAEYIPPLAPQFDFEGEPYVPANPVVFEFVDDSTGPVEPGLPLPRLVVGITARWHRPSQRHTPETGAPWSEVVAKELACESGWQRARAQGLVVAGRWDRVAAADVGDSLGWTPAVGQNSAAADTWRRVPERDRGLASGWEPNRRPRDQVRLRLVYNPLTPARDAEVQPRYQRSNEFGPRPDTEQARRASLYVPGPGPLDFHLGGRRYTPATAPQVFFDFRYVPPPSRIRPVDSGVGDRFQPARIINQWRRLLWGRARPLDPIPTGITYPDYPGPIVVIDPPVEPDILETYMIANSVSLVVLPSRTPLDATNIKASLDIDSFSWKLSADLFGRTSLNLVRPDGNGPKTVELDVNGWKWLFLVERYTRQVKFPGERYSISGASRTQLLAEPYAPRRSGVNSAPINARQAAEAQLEFTGFTLSWDATGIGPEDWTLPAGAFSYQDQTALQVIARVAESTGAVVRPAREADALSVLPRYREAVWLWAEAVMDRIIPAEVIGEVGGEWSPQPAWNSVYVSGTTHGVAVDVRRAGTAGELRAPEVFDDLVTDTAPARSRGICELSKGGDQEVVNLSIPLFPVGGSAPGLIEPAMLCEVREPGDTWRGLCLAVDISADGIGAARVKQALRLERHHGGA